MATTGTNIRQAMTNAGINFTYSQSGNATGSFDAILAVIGESPYAEGAGDRHGNTGTNGYAVGAIPVRNGAQSATWQPPGNQNTATQNASAQGRFNDQALLNNINTYRTANPGVPVIVIILSSRPMSIQNYVDNWDALVAGWLPGTEGGPAIVDVLFGEKDFVGKTAYTWRETHNTGTVIFEYGHGLKK